MWSLQSDMIHRFPQNCRTLKLPIIPQTVRSVAPGQFIRFNIANILNIPGVTLFDKSVNEIRTLTV